VLLVVFPMRSACRAPHHSGRAVIISAPMQPAQCRSGGTKRMGNARDRLGSLLCEHPELCERICAPYGP
jgi:hypothetical protein